MRMKMVCDDRTLRDVANEFLALKKAQKVRERTLSDYKKYIDNFLAQSQNTLVQRLLQHSSVSTTQRYIGIEPQKIETAIQNHAQLI